MLQPEVICLGHEGGTSRQQREDHAERQTVPDGATVDVAGPDEALGRAVRVAHGEGDEEGGDRDHQHGGGHCQPRAGERLVDDAREHGRGEDAHRIGTEQLHCPPPGAPRLWPVARP